MSDVAVRGVAPARFAFAAVLIAGTACGPETDAQVAYLRDPASRRAALVESLVSPGNGYSSLRLARYASGDGFDWEHLPVWNPRVAPLAARDLDAPPDPATLPADARALPLPDEATWDASTPLEALGEEAFFRYPAQLAPPASGPLTRALAVRYGLWLDQARGAGGLVRAEVATGTALAMTCATCHADVVGGRLVAGVPSARFDLGRFGADAVADPAQADRLLAWGPGRVDVTTTDGRLPVRLPDLRPLRWLSHLQYDATVRQLDVVSLAIRLETLIITAHGQSVRPPRIVALALARYLWSLAEALPAPGTDQARGAALFATTCAGCHAGPAYTGAPRALAEVGTDPAYGQSPDRGTGTYRVPSLRGVAARPTLLHDGTLPDLEALLDPARLAEGFTGGARGPGPVPGHEFGLSLPPADRAALVGFLRSL
jgi:mono/diheme cytochrome c family protein